MGHFFYSTNSINLKKAFEFQRDNIKWTFYDERQFMENLLQTRFNFLITTYALFMTALFMCKEPDSKFICLCIGCLITIIMGLTVYRVYAKLIIILQILYELGENHVSSIINTEADARKNTLFNVNPLIGIVIPILLPASFLAGIILLKCCGLNLK